MSGGVTVTLDMLTVALLIASILYAFCLILAQRKLDALHRLSPEMSTKKLLILSGALVAAVRIMTILGVAMMNMANIRVHYSLHPSNRNNNNGSNVDQAFYDEAMTVLFDLPNCIVVSTYVLLTLVWAECFLEARLHNENAIAWKKTLLTYFMIFNTLLYATQLIFYACIFFPIQPKNTVVRTVLYAAITGINFSAVLLVLMFYIYFNFRFSGFPFRSDSIRTTLAKVSAVMTLWSITRLIWGVATLLVFVNNIELLQDSNTPMWSFLVLLLMFFVCEILPIIAMLDYSYVAMIGMDTYLNSIFQQQKQQQQQQLLSLLLNNNTLLNTATTTTTNDGINIELNNNNNSVTDNDVFFSPSNVSFNASTSTSSILNTSNRKRQGSIDVLTNTGGTVRFKDEVENEQQRQQNRSSLLSSPDERPLLQHHNNV